MDMRLFLRGVRLERERILSTGYPYTLPIFQTLDELSFHHPVTFLVGENGSGKSTLIEGMAVAAGFNPEGGAPSFQFETESTVFSYVLKRHTSYRVMWMRWQSQDVILNGFMNHMADVPFMNSHTVKRFYPSCYIDFVETVSTFWMSQRPHCHRCAN
jgi:predicted ATPase